MTCSIGIAENKFLAKLGSDLEKPDGLVIITDENKDEILLGCDLEDFCGIGKRINNRLRKMNIYNVNDLRAASDCSLQKEFGVYGLKIKRWAFGIDNSEITPHQFQKEAKSFSKSRTLNKNTTSKKELKRNLYLLCEVLGANMRSERYWGDTIGLWLRYSSFSGFGKGSKIKKWTCDGYEIFKYSATILDGVELKQPVRAIGVWVSGVQPEKNIPRVFFPEDKLNEEIIQTIDAVNDKYGELTLIRASTCAMKLKEVVSGMGRKKIISREQKFNY
jgi:DNA polymerase IV